MAVKKYSKILPENINININTNKHGGVRAWLCVKLRANRSFNMLMARNCSVDIWPADEKLYGITRSALVVRLPALALRAA